MVGWLDRILGRATSGLIPGASVAVDLHPAGFRLLPLYRTKTPRGYFSNYSMDRAHWALVPADADDASLGAALRAGYDRVETLQSGSPNLKQIQTEMRTGAGFGTDAVRSFYGLPKRAAVWADMRHVGTSVRDGQISMVAMKAQGAPGGFYGFSPERVVVCPGTADHAAIGAALRRAFDLCE